MDVANALKWAFLVLPNYCLGQGIGDMFNNYNALDYFNKAVDTCVNSPYHLPRKFCEDEVRKLVGDKLEFQDNYLAWDNPGIGRYLIFLAWEGIFFFALVLLIEYRVFNVCTRFFARLRSYSTGVFTMEESTLADDEDVLAEKERVMTSADIDDVLVIKELTKVFPGNGRKFFCLTGNFQECSPHLISLHCCLNRNFPSHPIFRDVLRDFSALVQTFNPPS